MMMIKAKAEIPLDSYNVVLPSIVNRNTSLNSYMKSNGSVGEVF